MSPLRWSRDLLLWSRARPRVVCLSCRPRERLRLRGRFRKEPRVRLPCWWLRLLLPPSIPPRDVLPQMCLSRLSSLRGRLDSVEGVYQGVLDLDRVVAGNRPSWLLSALLTSRCVAPVDAMLREITGRAGTPLAQQGKKIKKNGQSVGVVYYRHAGTSSKTATNTAMSFCCILLHIYTEATDGRGTNQMHGWVLRERVSRAVLVAGKQTTADCRPPDAAWVRAVPRTTGPMPSTKRRKKEKRTCHDNNKK